MHTLILILQKENFGELRLYTCLQNETILSSTSGAEQKRKKWKKLIRIFFSFPMDCQRQKILPNQHRDLSHSILVTEEWLFSPFYNNN